jgi:hypothetical protein
MLKRMGQPVDADGGEKMGMLYVKHLTALEKWLRRQRNFDTLYVEYRQVIENPVGEAKAIRDFLWNRLDVSEMAKMVDKSLYRNRLTGSG